MNNSFISRLPAQHAALRYNKAFAIRVLDDDARVVPNLSSLPVAALREFCAAVLWLNASSPVRQTDIEGLSDAERDVLCRMLGISGDGVPLVVSRRIHAVISSAEPTASARSVSFYSLVHSFHPELDGDTASLKRTAQHSSFASNPATRAEAQEDAAMAVWCEAALLKPDDLQCLPIVLRKRLEKAHNIDSRWPEQVRADAAFNLVKAWRAPAASGASQQSAAPPPAPQPSPPNPPPSYTPPVANAVSTQHLGGGGRSLRYQVFRHSTAWAGCQRHYRGAPEFVTLRVFAARRAAQPSRCLYISVACCGSAYQLRLGPSGGPTEVA